MKLRLREIPVECDRDDESGMLDALDRRLGGYAPKLREFKPVRRSIDARQSRVKIVYTFDVDLTDADNVSIPGAVEPPPWEPLKARPGKERLGSPPVVVGGGPAGLFAALLLAEHGYAPVLLERGGDVRQRVEASGVFMGTREPDAECNALFGLGGAGTFSDGKLTTGVSHPWLEAVLGVLVECGAPKRILIDAKPHVGTDVLAKVVENLAVRIQLAGGAVKTSTRVDGVFSRDGALKGLSAGGKKIDADVAVLAIGHSARDTWTMLEGAGLRLEPKPFQMGIRVEHPQEWVDRARYGEFAGHPALGAADYKLAAKAGGAPVFSFCMCPGGETMATVNEPGCLALNGMSRMARDSRFASSGIVVTLRPGDFGGTSLETCLEFQRSIERACFRAGGSDYSAPAQRLEDFAAGLETSKLPQSSYLLGVAKARLDEILPRQIAGPLRTAMAEFNGRLKGYVHPEALALAPESRASSPVRIVRDVKTLEAVGMTGLYPVGEGAGYAGGIMSSALDGLNAARRIIERFAPPL